MATTIVVYKGNGRQSDYIVPFDYLAKRFVKVFVDDVEIKGGLESDPLSQFYFVDNTTIRLKTIPKAVEYITVRRVTSGDDRIVTFKDASILKANDLDVSLLQAYHIAEEARDLAYDAMTPNDTGNWDARNKKIINLASPTDDSDAVDYKTYKEDAQGAHQAHLEAVKAQQAARQAQQSAEVAQRAAETAQGGAGTAKTEAEAARDKAKEWATKESTPVEDSLYSSKYYAESASTSAKLAGDAETQAKEAQKNATAQASDAKNSANTATTKANEASTSASNAKLSETNAKTSETKAAEILSNVTTEGASQVQTIKAAGSSQVQTITSEGAKQIQAVKDQGTTTVGAVTTEGTKQVNLAKAEVTKAEAQAQEATRQAELAKGYANEAAQGQINSDWNETNPESKAFIKNKPNVATKKELQAGLEQKAPLQHTHTIANVEGLQTALDDKAPSSHNHTVSQITDLGTTYVPKTVRDGSNWMDSRSSTKKGTFIVGLDSSTLKQETVDNGIATFKSEIEVKTTGEVFIKGNKVYVTTNQEGSDKKEVATKDDVATKLDASKITSGTTDLEAGTSPLATGTLYFMYE